MLNYLNNIVYNLFRKKAIINLYQGIKKRQRRSCKRDDIVKFGDPVSKYNKYN